MALYKNMELQNGVSVNYHRITSLHIITNVQNIIEVSSYTDVSKRVEEQLAFENEDVPNVFVHTMILSTPYDQTATIENVYGYLKTLPQFEGAEDV